ncbi:MAG TPA: hypothetical protein VFD32_16240 [Dehalococcoidia bacterium]|nr:hypothetical protein [Dehalococcoidia bacterium]
MNERNVLEVLACDFRARPRGAASVVDVAPAVRSLRREPGTLVIEFAAEAALSVAEFVAAERLCCREIGWELSEAPAPTLRIRATPAQLDLLQQILIAPAG